MNDATNTSEMLAMLQMSDMQTVTVDNLATEHPNTAAEITKFDPVKTAQFLASLLTLPEYQCNCLRIEALIHMAVCLGKGKNRPSAKTVSRWFKEIGQGKCGMLEDPAEDLFVTNIVTDMGNARLISGLLESPEFYLGRIINAVSRANNEYLNQHILNPVYALLTISEEVCNRRKLIRYQLGGEAPLEEIDPRHYRILNSAAKSIEFSKEQIEQLGINLDDLAHFGFVPSKRLELSEQPIGHTHLEKYPLIHKNDKIVLVLPTAVHVAARRFIIEQFTDEQRERFLLPAIALEYAEHFADTPLLGGKLDAPIEFVQATARHGIAAISQKVDAGRYLNMIFHTDDLDGFEEDGFYGFNPDPQALLPVFEETIDQFYEDVRNQADFREAMSLVIGCGIGRGTNLTVTEKRRPNWRCQHISASDFHLLSNLDEFSPTYFWKLIDLQDESTNSGLFIHNLNGILNLVAWSKKLRGHLVPHSTLPEDFYGDNLVISIDPTSVRELRNQIYNRLDYHATRNHDGTLVPVIHVSDSQFSEENDAPLYAVKGYHDKYGVRVVYESPKRNWWAEISFNDDVYGDQRYQRWLAIRSWLRLAVPILEEMFPNLTHDSVLWRTNFAGSILALSEETEQCSYEDALLHLSFTADTNSGIVEVNASDQFEDAFFHEENIAERALVRTLVAAVAELADYRLGNEELEAVVQKIVISPLARQTHKFLVQEARDMLTPFTPNSPIKIEDVDSGMVKLKYGWVARERSEGNILSGRENCTRYLNETVKLLMASLKSDIRQYNRKRLIQICMLNHESAAVDRTRWRRTAGAIRALYKDQETVDRKIVANEQKLNAVFLGSRAVIEVALCESPVSGGITPGQIDISRLMAKVSQLIDLGSYSDAIHWEAMKPEIKITPLGDVLFNFDFFEEVIGPYFSNNTKNMVDYEIRNYAENFKQNVDQSEVVESQKEFFSAFEQEIGVSVRTVRTFVEYLEDIAVSESRPVIVKRRSELCDVKTEIGHVTDEDVSRILRHFVLCPRNEWDHLPTGYAKRNTELWRFRREYGFIKKPIIQLEKSDDPEFVFAPGIVRESFGHQLGCYFRGDYPTQQLHSSAMKQWKSKVDGTRGNVFESEVLELISGLSMKSVHAVTLPHILNNKLDRNYGDVDVLAWNPSTGNVFVIECKDVQFRKTPGEIAEQLRDFKGELDNSGKPDYLLKHHQRVQKLKEFQFELAKFCKLDSINSVTGLLVFKNPVPMQFAWQSLQSKSHITDFDSLADDINTIDIH